MGRAPGEYQDEDFYSTEVRGTRKPQQVSIFDGNGMLTHAPNKRRGGREGEENSSLPANTVKQG